jgi:hypothetical protein
MENTSGTAGVSGAETLRERGSEDRLAAGEGNVSIVGKVWEMQKRAPNPLTQGRAFCILGPVNRPLAGGTTPPPRKSFKSCNDFVAKCVYRGCGPPEPPAATNVTPKKFQEP